MTDYDYVLYDSVNFTNAANVDNTLFQIAQGADSTHTETFTNMRGAGSLPSGEAFSIMQIGFMPDINLAIADVQACFINSFLEIRISDLTVFKAPLAILAWGNGYGGHYTQAAAANEAIAGLMGNGYTLRKPINLQGGTALRVRVYQGTALSAASQLMKVLLGGTLSLPN